MPDLKTALQSALNEWNQPEQTPMQQHAQTQRPEGTRFFTRTSDTSRVTFEYVRDYPYSTTRQICDALAAQGHKRGSVSSLLSQMARAGNITRDHNGTYVTKAKEYAPVKLSALRKVRNTPTRTGRNPKAEDKPKIVITRKEAVVAPAPNAYDVDALISTLTIAQARDLFAALKRMFA